ncbi:MAG: BspA family leucine-rich repeat surface protein, partial [Spirochaetota bacterium]
GQIKDMSALFANMHRFNADIGDWDTSRVTNMERMFAGASRFNQDISRWNTANVENMSGMFHGASDFGKPKLYELPKSGLSASISASVAANEAPKKEEEKDSDKDLGVGKWNVANVENMSQMFAGAKYFNDNITGWQPAQVSAMDALFEGAANFNQPLFSGEKPWQTPKLQTAVNMFKNAANFNQPLAAWKVPKLRDASGMFEGAKKFSQNLSSWAFPRQAKSAGIFVGSRISRGKFPKSKDFLPSQPDNVKVTAYTPNSVALEWTAVDNATGYLVFYSPTRNFAIDHTTLKRVVASAEGTRKTVDGLEAGTTYYFKIVGTALNYWDTPTSTEIEQGTQLAAPQKLSAEATVSSILIEWEPVKSARSYDVYLSQDIPIVDIAGMTPVNVPQPRKEFTALVATTTYHFRVVARSPKYKASPASAELAYATANKIRPKSKKELIVAIQKMYTGYEDNTDIQATTSLANIDTSLITDMSGLFENKTYFNGDISTWDTAQVTNMERMFAGAKAFNQPLKPNGASWNTSRVTNMKQMFYRAKAFNQNIGDWDTSSVNTMEGMFARDYPSNASVFNNGDNDSIKNWNTAQVTNMADMFAGAIKFNQPIHPWNTTSVTNMEKMFYKAEAFNRPLKPNGASWNTSQVRSLKKMFYQARAFNQDIGTWDTSSVRNMSFMFYGAESFKKWSSSPTTQNSCHAQRILG